MDVKLVVVMMMMMMSQEKMWWYGAGGGPIACRLSAALINFRDLFKASDIFSGY